jgi:PPP family 3-phenylpropionic acid transporter
VLGGAAALLRWTAYAFAPPLWLLFPLQALHALTFAASFMASLRLIERLAPPQSASAAQAINSALSAGFMLGVGTLAAGPAVRRLRDQGLPGHGAMGGLGLLGAVKLTRLKAFASDLVVHFAFQPGDDPLGGGDRVHLGGVDHQFGASGAS